MRGISYLTLQEVADKLKMSRTESAGRWCLKNNIRIHKCGNKNVVIEFEFKIAFEKPLIEQLKNEYGAKWREYYDAYNSENVTDFYLLAGEKEDIISKNMGFNPDDFLKEIGYVRP